MLRKEHWALQTGRAEQRRKRTQGTQDAAASFTVRAALAEYPGGQKNKVLPEAGTDNA